ncbi:MAG: DEAD/DEAH box helicase family protein, partial [Phycisphaerae bacterium]
TNGGNATGPTAPHSAGAGPRKVSRTPYQADFLQKLKGYFRRAVEFNASGAAARAFSEITSRHYLKVDQLPEMPYVCLRVPTGGGKTFLAAHAVGIAISELLRQNTGLVLWLAPTKTIVEQTLAALNDRRHPYREALDAAFGGNVVVTGVQGALYLQRSALDGNTVVIVSTLAALRVTDTEGRKCYEANGNLMAHFTGLEPQQIRELTQNANTDSSLITPSLANAIRLRHPIVIMDEAHNARTHLSFDTLQRFSPSCVIELTATPETVHKPQADQFASNVLHHVSAVELNTTAL